MVDEHPGAIRLWSRAHDRFLCWRMGVGGAPTLETHPGHDHRSRLQVSLWRPRQLWRLSPAPVVLPSSQPIVQPPLLTARVQDPPRHQDPPQLECRIHLVRHTVPGTARVQDPGADRHTVPGTARVQDPPERERHCSYKRFTQSVKLSFRSGRALCSAAARRFTDVFRNAVQHISAALGLLAHQAAQHSCRRVGIDGTKRGQMAFRFLRHGALPPGGLQNGPPVCEICCAAPRNAAFLHANGRAHSYACLACSRACLQRDEERRCPICRERVERLVEVILN